MVAVCDDDAEDWVLRTNQ